MIAAKPSDVGSITIGCKRFDFDDRDGEILVSRILFSGYIFGESRKPRILEIKQIRIETFLSRFCFTNLEINVEIV